MKDTTLAFYLDKVAIEEFHLDPHMDSLKLKKCKDGSRCKDEYCLLSHKSATSSSHHLSVTSSTSTRMDVSPIGKRYGTSIHATNVSRDEDGGTSHTGDEDYDDDEEDEDSITEEDSEEEDARQPAILKDQIGVDMDPDKDEAKEDQENAEQEEIDKDEAMQDLKSDPLYLREDLRALVDQVNKNSIFAIYAKANPLPSFGIDYCPESPSRKFQ